MYTDFFKRQMKDKLFCPPSKCGSLYNFSNNQWDVVIIIK